MGGDASKKPNNDGVIILTGGEIYRINDARGKTWIFEDHPYCGPVVVDIHHNEKKQPPENSKFWEAVTNWYQQGKKTIDGIHGLYCEWTNPTVDKFVHVSGNHYMLKIE